MVKTTKEFIKQFKLDQENFEFNREYFLKELNNYFLELVENAKLQSTKFTFDIFKQCVKQTEMKFWAISNKKVGTSFSKGLWNAFYAIYIIKARAKYFPEIDKAIKDKKSLYNKTEPKQ